MNSSTTNDCNVTRSENATVVVTVMAEDGNSAPMESVSVYAFDECTYTSFSGMKDDFGWLFLQLPKGDDRFCTDLKGT